MTEEGTSEGPSDLPKATGGASTLEEYGQGGTRWKNGAWGFLLKPGGKVTQEQVNQALLMDIRALLRSVRGMMVFFTVLAVIGLIFGFIVGFNVLTGR